MQEESVNKKSPSGSKKQNDGTGWNVQCKKCKVDMDLEFDDPQICGIWEWHFRCKLCKIKNIKTELFDFPNNCEIEEEWIENQ